MAVQALWLQNLDYPARWDRSVFDNVWDNEGVIGTNDFLVSAQASPNMTVRAAAGVAVVIGDDQAFQGKYLCREESVTSPLTITAAPGSGTRYDLVVLQVRDPNAGGASGDDAIVTVVTGVASATPVDPAIPASSLVLARVVVPSGTGSITSSNIVDLRAVASLKNADPVGAVQMFAGATVPNGWLLCDGSAVSQTTYPALFSVIGTAYNTSGGQSAPGAGLFRLPLLTGRVPVGRLASDTNFDVLGETGGASTVTLTTAEMPSHTHTQDAHNHTQNAHNHTQDAHNHSQNGHAHTIQPDGSHSHSVSNSSTIEQHKHGLPARQTASTSHTHGGTNTIAAGMSGTDVIIDSYATPSIITPSLNSNGSHGHTADAATATNNDATATNQAATATNNATTATNQNTGGGGAHSNLQPYLVLNFIIKT